MLRKQFKLLLLLLTFSVFYANSLKAQLFTYVPDVSSGFTTSELQLIDSLRQDPLYDSIMIVQVSDVISTQDSGGIQINLPGSTITQAFISRLEMESLETPYGDYVWNGNFIGLSDDDNGDPAPTFDGAIHIFKEAGEYYGTLEPFDANIHYKLISLGVGKNALIKFNMTEYYNHVSSCTAEMNSSPAEKSTSTGPCDPVRVLVLYMENAQWGRNIDQEINQAMALLDGATYNSLNTLNSYTKFSLAGKQMLTTTQFSPTGVAENDADYLAGNTWANYYRNLYKADLVICLTNAGYSGLIGNSSEIGPNDYAAYAVLEAKYMNTDYAFSHEIGHLMGCRHQQSSVSNLTYHDNTAGYDHGYQIKTGTSYGWKRYIDIMHENYNGARRDHIFSTPGQIWRGKLYGTNSDNFAAKTLLDNHCTVSEFRSDDYHPFDATITGPHTKTTGYTVNLTGNPINGFAGYKFDWWLSYDGGANWFNAAVQNPVPIGSLSFVMPDVATVLVWMKATDGVNQTKVAFKTIYNDHPKWMYLVHGPYSAGKSGVTNISSKEASKIEFNAAPNPAKNFVKFNVNVPTQLYKDGIIISILDVFGKEIAQKIIENPSESWKYDTSSLPSGTYFAKLHGSQINLTTKITIIK